MPKDSSRSARTRLRESRTAPYRTSTGASTWNTNWGFTSTLGPKQPVRRELFPSTPTSSRPMSRKRSSASGHYQGRLPKPKRVARSGKVALYGHRLELERYATAEHNNVCYLGAQAAPAAAIGKSVGVAFLRMIMKRHYQMEYSSTSQVILTTFSGTGTGTPLANSTRDYVPCAIRFWRKTTSATGVPTYDVPAAATCVLDPTAGTVSATSVSGFGDWFNSTIFMASTFGGLVASSNQQQFELHAYQFVMCTIIGGVAQFVNQAVCPLEGQYLKAYSTVRMHIQNVTPADGVTETGATLLSTRIDANPIKGKLMRFNDPTPVIKDDRGVDGSGAVDYGYRLMQDTDGDGIIWPNQTTPPAGNWTQLPTADMFRNCSGMANISLEPGAIKDYSLSFKFSGTLQALMKGFNTSSNLSAAGVPLSSPLPSTVNKQFGQSFMFALEKRMPTGPAKVSVNFHYELYAGSVFGGRRKTPMVRQSIDNLTTVPDS